MRKNDNDTVVDKAVNFVKDVFGIQHDAVATETRPEDHDLAAEAPSEPPARLDPNTFVVSPSGQIIPGSFPARETDTERLRREVGEDPPQKSARELNAENAWHEDNG